jgi:hypothetical protein
MSTNDTETNKGVRKSTLILAAIAIVFYVGFILLGVLQA